MVHYLISAPPLLCSFVIARPSSVQQTAKRNNLTIPDQMGVSGAVLSEKCIGLITAHLALCFVKKTLGQYKNSIPCGSRGGAPYRSLWDLSVGAPSTLPRKQNKLFNKLPPNNHNRHKHFWLKRVLLRYYGEKEALVPLPVLSSSSPKVTFRATRELTWSSALY